MLPCYAVIQIVARKLIEEVIVNVWEKMKCMWKYIWGSVLQDSCQFCLFFTISHGCSDLMVGYLICNPQPRGCQFDASSWCSLCLGGGLGQLRFLQLAGWKMSSALLTQRGLQDENAPEWSSSASAICVTGSVVSMAVDTCILCFSTIISWHIIVVRS